jgi:serine/threonine protein phosphatase PrpC
LSFKSDPSLPPEKQVITANPDTLVIDLNFDTDDFIVVACDGLWEVMKSQEVVDYVLHGLQGVRGGTSPRGGTTVASNREEDSPKSSPASSASLLPTSLSELIGNILDVACSEDVGLTEGIGGDNMTCILIDLRPGKPLVPLDRVSKSSDPFLTKPSGLKAFEFRSGSSSGDEFEDMEWECRIEKLDDADFPK